MHILLVNDDGIHAPGLNSLHAELVKFAQVTVVAPAVEQSGVGHSITYLHPLLAHREYRQDEFFGWKVEGSPADCVKLGIMELAQPRPDLVVSGINHGANVGINILYSGTVAAAIEGAFRSDLIRTVAMAGKQCPEISTSCPPGGTTYPADYGAKSARRITLEYQLSHVVYK